MVRSARADVQETWEIVSKPAITFDFHDTLVRCPEWFDLEVKTLVSDFLRWRADEDRFDLSHVDLLAVDAAYRTLRAEIIDTGLELPAEECIAVTLERVRLSASTSDIEEGTRHLMMRTLEHATPIDGAVETVRAISAEGVPLAIVSSAVYHPFLEWSLAKFGLHDQFDVVTTSASCGYYKTRPEIYTHTLERLSAPAEVSVHIGDSYRFDVHGAGRAGMRTVWLNAKGAQPLPDLLPPHHTVETMVGSAPSLLRLLRDGAA